MRFLSAAVFLFHRIEPCRRPTGVAADWTQRRMQQIQSQMGPMMQQAATKMLEATLIAMAKPENAALLADFTRNYYEALIKRGFTPEQALQIVIAAGAPRGTISVGDARHRRVEDLAASPSGACRACSTILRRRQLDGIDAPREHQ